MTFALRDEVVARRDRDLNMRLDGPHASSNLPDTDLALIDDGAPGWMTAHIAAMQKTIATGGPVQAAVDRHFAFVKRARDYRISWRRLAAALSTSERSVSESTLSVSFQRSQEKALPQRAIVLVMTGGLLAEVNLGREDEIGPDRLQAAAIFTSACLQRSGGAVTQNEWIRAGNSRCWTTYAKLEDGRRVPALVIPLGGRSS